MVQTYYHKFLYKKMLQRGQLPVWNPYIYNGYPFLAHPYNGLFYPPNLLFVFLPINKAYTWAYVLHVFMAGSFMYLLMNYLCPQAALFSAICFMFSGFVCNRIWAGHYEMLITSVWIPLVLLMYIQGHPVLCALVLTYQFFAGHNQTSLFTSLMLLLYAIYNSNYVFLAQTISLFLVFSAVQWIPTLHFLLTSTRANGIPFKYRIYGSLPPSHLIRAFLPLYNFLETGFYGDPVLGEVAWEHTYYIGILPLILACMWFKPWIIYFIFLELVAEYTFRQLWKRHILHI